MEPKEGLKKLLAERRQVSWQAMFEIDACAKALGEQCQVEIGISYPELHLILSQLAAAVGAGKCDGAYDGRSPAPKRLRLFLWSVLPFYFTVSLLT